MFALNVRRELRRLTTKRTNMIRFTALTLVLGVGGALEGTTGRFADVEPLGPLVNSQFCENQPAPSGDDLTLAFSSDRRNLSSAIERRRLPGKSRRSSIV